MKTRSLNFRLLFSASLILAVFFVLVAIVLQRGFRESAEQALKEKLQVQVYALLTAAELDSSGQLQMPVHLPEPRFDNPGSGLIAFIQKADATIIWHSASAVGFDVFPLPALKPGDARFLHDNKGFFVLHFAVVWEVNSGQERAFVFSVAENDQALISQVARFRNTLTRWLLILGAVLVLVQFFVLRWSLKPLRTIINDLEAIERGQKTRLEGRYPNELQRLASNLNALISSERAHLERYRNTLADLAHSLKTPLAILRGSIATGPKLPANQREIVETQISRMNEIVEYHLQRAAAKGQKKITGRVDLVPLLAKIISALKKVYEQKNIDYQIDMPQHCLVYCEEGDMYEIAGNLLDNACKWCTRQVRVTVQQEDHESTLQLCIEDDGPGIPAEKLELILKRGVRADENTQGHGIGMAVVNDLVSLLGGELSGCCSRDLGGMLWRVRIPKILV